jgi:hypothetical protein
MAVVQPIPDDELAAEFADGWGPDHDERPPPAVPDRPLAVLDRAPARPERPAARPVRRRPGDPADLREAAARVRPVSLAGERSVPVVPALEAVVPEGVRRGSTVAVGGTAATTLALALAAGPSAAGSWVAAVGLPGLGLAAAAELGVALERLVVVESPPAEQWATIMAALVGAFDVVLATPDLPVRPAESRRLAARARERGSVIVLVEATTERLAPPARRSAGPRQLPGLEGDLLLTVPDVVWSGVGEGHGTLGARRVVVEARGRGRSARPRRAELWLPDAEGHVRTVEPGEPGASPVTGGPDTAGNDLVAARRERVRRVARQPLVTSGPLDGPAEERAPGTVWSDAG